MNIGLLPWDKCKRVITINKNQGKKNRQTNHRGCGTPLHRCPTRKGPHSWNEEGEKTKSLSGP